jgi:hypothetical protein
MEKLIQKNIKTHLFSLMKILIIIKFKYRLHKKVQKEKKTKNHKEKILSIIQMKFYLILKSKNKKNKIKLFQTEKVEV